MKQTHDITGIPFVTEDAYLVGIKSGHFRCGDPAKIIDTVMLSRDGDGINPVPCFHIVFSDGQEDWWVIDFLTMRIISETDVNEGNIPPLS
jgi:hypothetical protein